MADLGFGELALVGAFPVSMSGALRALRCAALRCAAQ